MNTNKPDGRANSDDSELENSNLSCGNPDCIELLDKNNINYVWLPVVIGRSRVSLWHRFYQRIKRLFETKLTFREGDKHPDNLLALCAVCRAMDAKGDISQTALQAWKILQLARSGALQARQDDLKIAAVRSYPKRRD